ncbi:hypothetical protein ACFQ88_06780 [Paenibacillus sp. NPDC056579]|uniref:hypothetical protein n=1 Tax=Paenibacillus sp. NPDC056579 TaxID=3345871 RepID=UPI0036C555EE
MCRCWEHDFDGPRDARLDSRDAELLREAAGTAAALLTKQSLCSTHSMNIDDLQKRLVRQGK